VATRVRRLVPTRRGDASDVPTVGHTGNPSLDPATRLDAEGRAVLDVLTLNLAHGRSTGFHQAFQRPATIRKNLDAIAALLRRERPDIAAFQEADGPSIWSGRFDHVDYVATAAGFSHHLRGTHMAAPRTRYGTAIAARLPLADPLSVTFAPSPPTFSKGFVVSTVLHPHLPAVPIDIVSVHLDFARPVVRRRQIETLIETLRGRDRMMVVLGDFNTRWDAREHTLRRMAAALDLEAHAPDEPLVTFPFHGTRLDWIFASRPITFVTHRVLPDSVSDHLAVFARIRLPE
jgi:endonuclease/exonuclease/phosphatase family metal-dependent hydrolase